MESRPNDTVDADKRSRFHTSTALWKDVSKKAKKAAGGSNKGMIGLVVCGIAGVTLYKVS